MKQKKSNLFILLFFVLLTIYFFIWHNLLLFIPDDMGWNFQSIYKMYNGGTIYIDNNVIHTPLFFVIGNFFFRIFGANMVTFHLYNTIILIGTLILIYFIFRKMEINKLSSIFYTFLICMYVSTFFCGISANYNTLAIFFILIGVLLFMTRFEKKFYNILQGIIIFLIFFTKQNFGFFYAIGIILFELINTKFSKKFFKNQFSKLFSFLICFLIAMIIMYCKGNLYHFFDLCFGSLLEFGGTNRLFSLSGLTYLVLIILTYVLSFFILKSKNVTKETKQTIQFLLCLSSSLLLTTYPILNPYHINLVCFFYFILFLYIIHTFLIEKLLTLEQINLLFKILMIIIGIVLILLLILLYIFTYTPAYHFDKSHPFYGTSISIKKTNYLGEKVMYKDYMDAVTNYIKEKKSENIKVIDLTYQSATYMVPLNINNGELDMCLRGNLGYHGIAKTIKKISKMKNTEFLIFTDNKDSHRQQPTEIREYVLSNFEKIGELLDYSIYIND